MEAIFEAVSTSFAKYSTEEPARTALATLGSSKHDGVGRFVLKFEFESLPSKSHLRMQTTLAELATSAAGNLTAMLVFSSMASALKSEDMDGDPEVAKLIIDYRNCRRAVARSRAATGAGPRSRKPGIP
jgi:hypothetical protein